MSIAIMCDRAIRGQSVGFFAPSFKILGESYEEMVDRLRPIVARASKMEGVIRLTTGGRIDFWSTDNEYAGRSRRYHLVVLDEIAFAKESTMMGIWEKAIKPTLLDFKGECIATSTPDGINEDNFFWRICNLPEYGFTEYYAPTINNPYMPADEIEKLRETTNPMVFAQEYLAEWVDFSGAALFRLEDFLENGKPIPCPFRIFGNVYAVIDCAVKTGTDNDSTAVLYCALQPGFMFDDKKPRIYWLDWELIQIEAYSMLEWIPSVHARLEELSKEYQSTLGVQNNAGIFIEDAAGGSVLLQFCKRNNINATPIESKLVMLGKDARALSASPHVASGSVKITEYAYNKRTKNKGVERNHLMAQIGSFRIGDKEAARRADDLLDTACYSVVLALSDQSAM